jgi:hypothetical protein
MSVREMYKFSDEVKKALDLGLARHLNLEQGRLAQANPKDTGRMASSWFVGKNQPRLDTAPSPWAAPGRQIVETEKYSGKIEYDGTWYISNNVPYAERVAFDPKWAKGGDGGPAWYALIITQSTRRLEAAMRKFLKKV